MDSQRDGAQQRERFEETQTNKLARNKFLEEHEKQTSALQGSVRRQLETYENMLVSETDPRFV